MWNSNRPSIYMIRTNSSEKTRFVDLAAFADLCETDDEINNCYEFRECFSHKGMWNGYDSKGHLVPVCKINEFETKQFSIEECKKRDEAIEAIWDCVSTMVGG